MAITPFKWVTIRETDARARLKRMIAFTQEPLLTEADVDDLMFIARKTDRFNVWPDRYTFWTPNTPYALGTQIVPTTRNGHVYQVTVAGTSGANEPVWNLISGGNTIDNASITWQEQGATFWLETWDLNLAACEGWRRKAGLTANAYDFTSAGKTLNRAQILEHCMSMIKLYGRKTFGSIAFGKGSTANWALLEQWLGAPPVPHLLYDDHPMPIIPGVETNWS
jgi:hypothetical protein